jgi:hypothetical protein
MLCCCASINNQADADGATDINDLDRLYTRMKRTEETVESLGGNVGIVVGSR